MMHTGGVVDSPADPSRAAGMAEVTAAAQPLPKSAQMPGGQLRVDALAELFPNGRDDDDDGQGGSGKGYAICAARPPSTSTPGGEIRFGSNLLDGAVTAPGAGVALGLGKQGNAEARVIRDGGEENLMGFDGDAHFGAPGSPSGATALGARPERGSGEEASSPRALPGPSADLPGQGEGEAARFCPAAAGPKQRPPAMITRSDPFREGPGVVSRRRMQAVHKPSVAGDVQVGETQQPRCTMRERFNHLEHEGAARQRALFASWRREILQTYEKNKVSSESRELALKGEVHQLEHDLHLKTKQYNTLSRRAERTEHNLRQKFRDAEEEITILKSRLVKEQGGGTKELRAVMEQLTQVRKRITDKTAAELQRKYDEFVECHTTERGTWQKELREARQEAERLRKELEQREMRSLFKASGEAEAMQAQNDQLAAELGQALQDLSTAQARAKESDRLEREAAAARDRAAARQEVPALPPPPALPSPASPNSHRCARFDDEAELIGRRAIEQAERLEQSLLEQGEAGGRARDRVAELDAKLAEARKVIEAEQSARERAEGTATRAAEEAMQAKGKVAELLRRCDQHVRDQASAEAMRRADVADAEAAAHRALQEQHQLEKTASRYYRALTVHHANTAVLQSSLHEHQDMLVTALKGYAELASRFAANKQSVYQLLIGPEQRQAAGQAAIAEGGAFPDVAQRVVSEDFAATERLNVELEVIVQAVWTHCDSSVADQTQEVFCKARDALQVVLRGLRERDGMLVGQQRPPDP
eukprot:TRINITY_DN6810_c0_g1_i1.p1 TRINITY_DN6810_c0_g1~~TRINITY_DN6810_c0_g1_i1.p1  ORF type:complete len:765 (+),score=245.90 TRINITY_DN6810_c0_g1_i1:98-2392(+)